MRAPNSAGALRTVVELLPARRRGFLPRNALAVFVEVRLPPKVIWISPQHYVEPLPGRLELIKGAQSRGLERNDVELIWLKRS